MDIKWTDKLKQGQRYNPVVLRKMVDLPDDFIQPPDNITMESIFKTLKGKKLQTWGRKKDENGKTIVLNDPHWIAVNGSTTIHYDPRYPRYSHHLKVRVDYGIVCRGISCQEMLLKRGLYYVLDAHSPHQVVVKNKSAVWNVAISIDSHDILDTEETIKRLVKYGQTQDITNDAN